MTKRFSSVLSRSAPPPTSAYSQAIAFGDLVVTSGFLGTHPDGSGVVPGGFEAEMRRAMDNVEAVLREAGCSFADVIRVTVSLVDIGRFAEMDRVMRDYITEPFPARNTIGVAALWGGAQVGLDVWAVRPGPAAR